MLGSLAEADDAVQEAWLRLNRSDASEIQNLGGWLTTVVARISLDMLRSRASRREEPVAPAEKPAATPDPEQEAALADAVGLALLVVLDRLNPAERLAFVLHDLFGVSFDEIASIIGKSSDATRQLASRARRRVQGAPTDADLSQHRSTIEAFLKALRAADMEGLVALLDPDFSIRAGDSEVRGAREWAKQAVVYAKGAAWTRIALINGQVGAILAPKGKLVRALTFEFRDGKIARAEVIADPAVLSQLEISAL
jgi:RNA polymerase sigma-70 factor (ECF subfamily)